MTMKEPKRPKQDNGRLDAMIAELRKRTEARKAAMEHRRVSKAGVRKSKGTKP